MLFLELNNVFEYFIHVGRMLKREVEGGDSVFYTCRLFIFYTDFLILCYCKEEDILFEVNQCIKNNLFVIHRGRSILYFGYQ